MKILAGEKIIKWLAVLLLMVILEMVLASAVYAECGVDETCPDDCDPTVQSCEGGGTPSGGGDETSYTFMGNPLAGNEQKSAGVTGLAGRVTKTIIGVVGSVTLLMMMYGGFLWLTAAGNEEKLGKAKKTLGWAMVGLVAVFIAYAVINFVITNITATTLQKQDSGQN